MSVTVATPSWDELIQRINQLEDQLRKTTLVRGLQAGADVVAGAIGKAAPRSVVSRPPGGRTQTWRTGKHAADNVKRDKPQVREFDASIKVGWDAGANDPYFYMKFFEFGSSSIQARPFMEMAADDASEMAGQAMADVLLKELENG